MNTPPLGVGPRTDNFCGAGAQVNSLKDLPENTGVGLALCNYYEDRRWTRFNLRFCGNVKTITTGGAPTTDQQLVVSSYLCASLAGR